MQEENALVFSLPLLQQVLQVDLHMIQTRSKTRIKARLNGAYKGAIINTPTLVMLCCGNLMTEPGNIELQKLGMSRSMNEHTEWASGPALPPEQCAQILGSLICEGVRAK